MAHDDALHQPGSSRRSSGEAARPRCFIFTFPLLPLRAAGSVYGDEIDGGRRWTCCSWASSGTER
jgi:hypothetical protein